MGAWVASAREAKGPWVRGREWGRELELPIKVEREEYELWGEAFGVLSFEPSLSFAVKIRMPADLCLSEGVAGVVTLLAEGEPRMLRVGRGWRWCWCCEGDSVSIGEVRPEASTDLDEEWAEWDM